MTSKVKHDSITVCYLLVVVNSTTMVENAIILAIKTKWAIEAQE